MEYRKRQNFKMNSIGRYAIRKLSIGAASILIGFGFAIGGPQVIKADDLPAKEQVIKTDINQNENKIGESSDKSTAEKDLTISLPDIKDKQENKDVKENKSKEKTDLVVPDKDNTLEIKTRKSELKDNQENNIESSVIKKNVTSQAEKATNQKSGFVISGKDADKAVKDSLANKNSDTETLSLKSLGKGSKLSANQLLNSKFEVPSISVGNKVEFENAIISAPTDGTEKLIKLINDINLENDLIEIKNGQNVVITNDDQQRKLMIGNQIRVTNGGHLKFKATQKDGIVITRPNGENPYNRKLVSDLNGYENYWGVLYACGQGSELDLENTKITGFHYIYVDDSNLDNTRHDWIENGNSVSRTTQQEFTGSLETTLPDGRIDGSNSINDAGLIVISGKATLKMINSAITDNLIYDYSDQKNSYTRENPRLEIGTLCIRYNASCTMDKGSEISDNTIGPVSYLGGNCNLSSAESAGGVLILNGHFTANGSTFKNNTGTAGAIYASGYTYFDNSDVILHGVKILNNTAYYAGGGIFLEGNSDDLNSKLHATIDDDSVISDNAVGNRNATFSSLGGLVNSSGGDGGGITVSDNYMAVLQILNYLGRIHPYDTITKDGRTFKVLNDYWVKKAQKVNLVQLTINGATITNNFATDTGGGIYVDTNGVTIKKAIIANNDCHLGMGGGIYVSLAPYSIKLNDAVIYDNKAKMVVNPNTGRPVSLAFDYDDYDATGSGGGVWLCPTGQSEIKITNGMAIFDNSADVGGDDLWNELKDPNFHSVISNRALGGGDANWVHDRDSLNGQKFVGPNIGDNVGLKSNLTKDAKRFAETLAPVKIYGNIAAWGGGVGSNGGVITTQNTHGEDDKDKDITITKHWADANDPERPKSVTIDVIANYKGSNYLIASFKLSDTDNWTYELKDLPTNVDYNFLEDATGLDINGDHQPDYTESNGKIIFVKTTDDTSYYTLLITNTKKPSNPPTPTPGGSEPTQPQPTQPQPSNPQPTLPQPSVPQPTKPQPSNVSTHTSNTSNKPKSTTTISTHTGKTTRHKPIIPVKQVKRQNKVYQNKAVSWHQQSTRRQLPPTGAKKSAVTVTSLGLLLIAGAVSLLIDHKRRI